MRSLRTRLIVGAVVLVASIAPAACRRAVVIVPQRSGGFTARDTLYGTYRRNNVRVTFRHDTTWRVDTVVRLDTLWVGGTRTILRVDTLRILRVDTLARRDTVRITVREMLMPGGRDTVTRVDTVRVTIFHTDTMRLAGRRMLFVPPGHYPPEGQCRVWIHDRPPGQQADAAPCHALGRIPAGAFILFAGEAWDFDYDWLAAPGGGGAPQVILTLKRRGGP